MSVSTRFPTICGISAIWHLRRPFYTDPRREYLSSRVCGYGPAPNRSAWCQPGPSKFSLPIRSASTVGTRVTETHTYARTLRSAVDAHGPFTWLRHRYPNFAPSTYAPLLSPGSLLSMASRRIRHSTYY